jgi:hypothetical protein
MSRQRYGFRLLMLVWTVCSLGHAQISDAVVQHALSDTLHAMHVRATVVPGSLHFQQGRSHGTLASEDVLAERASISGSKIQARLRCKPLTACLPFYASADLRFENEGIVQRSWSAAADHISTSGPALRPGDYVVFTRELNGVRIQVRAVALQRSYLGQMTRVRATDGRHEVMRGRVSADHVVRSES